MKYKSSRNIVQKIIRDYNIVNLGWVEDANIWIREALQDIGTNENKILIKYDFTVNNVALNLPCDVEDILGIMQDDCFLRFQNKSGTLTFENSGELRPYINNNRIWFNKEGEIKGQLIYYSFQENCEGDILLIDHIRVTRAVTNYIILMLMQRGMKHPVLDFTAAYQLWEDTKVQATNYCNFPAPYEIQNVLAEFANPII